MNFTFPQWNFDWMRWIETWTLLKKWFRIEWLYSIIKIAILDPTFWWNQWEKLADDHCEADGCLPNEIIDSITATFRPFFRPFFSFWKKNFVEKLIIGLFIVFKNEKKWNYWWYFALESWWRRHQSAAKQLHLHFKIFKSLEWRKGQTKHELCWRNRGLNARIENSIVNSCIKFYWGGQREGKCLEKCHTPSQCVRVVLSFFFPLFISCISFIIIIYFFLNSGFITVFLPRWEMAKLSQLAVTSVVSQHGERRRRGQWQPLFSSHRLRFPPPTCYLGEVRPAAARSRGGGIRGEEGGWSGTPRRWPWSRRGHGLPSRANKRGAGDLKIELKLQNDNRFVLMK